MKFRKPLAALAPLALSVPALAADLSVTLALPQLNVAEYHRPYVAIWIERPDQGFVANLSVLYDQKKRDNGGTKWLKDMRQWWRKSGRDLQMPVDGVSGATRAPGEHTLTYAGSKAPLDKLAAGDYLVVIETAREAGGRELVRVPFKWPAKATQATTTSAHGSEELGAVTVQVKP
jgi:hypothetical protein